MFRNGRSVRFKALKKLLKHFEHRSILTGTPAPKGLEGLWGQIYMLDSGVRLGEYITHYRNKYFYPSGYGGYTYLPQDGAEEEIYAAIDDIIMHKGREVLSMPPLTPVQISVELPEKAMRIYKDMEKEFIIDLEKRGVVAASTGAVASMKCRQLASGAIYDDKKNVTIVHTEKLEALKELVNGLEGHPLMVIYEFNMEAEYFLKEFPQAEIIRGGVTEIELERIEESWNKGEVEILFLQPRAGGHGLNLQKGGCADVCWYTPTWDAELFEQTYSRVWRQNVAGGVRMHMIVAEGTVDQIVYKALKEKETVQDALKKALTK
jgi:SNF2 family DNA or RNA helicase